MGFEDRDYERSYDTGSGWRDGGGGGGLGGGLASWSANSKLLAVLVAVFLAQNLVNGFTEWFVLPADWFAEPWRVYGLISYSLLHSTSSLAHLLFNGIALFFFGRVIDQRLGGREYLTFFFAAAAFAGLAWSGSEYFLTNGNKSAVLLGASGGIAGIVVLFALWYPNVQVYIMGILPVPAWLMAVLFIGQDVMGAVGRSGNVAYTAHLGGALFGYLYYRYGWRLTSFLPDWLGGGAPAFGQAYGSSRGRSGGGLSSLFKRKPKLRVHREAVEDDDRDDDRLDEILRKIQASGRDSLTRSEARYLEQASKRFKEKRGS